VPTHYGFTFDSRLDRIEAEYQRLLSAAPEDRDPPAPAPSRSRALSERVEAILASMDDRGAWVEANDRIESRTFAENVETLSRYLRATRPDGGE
jgi:hypothetical protein